jgi:hypothetical protein
MWQMWTCGHPFSRRICSQDDIRQGPWTLKRNTCSLIYSFYELCIISFSLHFLCASHALLNLAKCESSVEIWQWYGVAYFPTNVWAAFEGWYTLWERKRKNMDICNFPDVIFLFDVSFAFQRTFAFNSMLFPLLWMQVKLESSFCSLSRSFHLLFLTFTPELLQQPILSFLGFRCLTAKQFSAFFTGIILLWMQFVGSHKDFLSLYSGYQNYSIISPFRDTKSTSRRTKK